MQLFEKMGLLFILLSMFITCNSSAAGGLREFTSQKNVYVTEWSKLKHRAELGDPDALFALGNFYFDPPKGSGFRINYRKAAEFYFQASLRDYPAAQYNTALMLHKGLGFKEDIIESYVWFFIASHNTSPVAKHINHKTSQIVTQLSQELSSQQLADAQKRIVEIQDIIKTKRYRDAKLPDHTE